MTPPIAQGVILKITLGSFENEAYTAGIPAERPVERNSIPTNFIYLAVLFAGINVKIIEMVQLTPIKMRHAKRRIGQQP